MTDDERRAIADAAARLVRLAHDATAPEEARQAMSELAAAWPGIEVDLVWDRQELSRVVHYDALLHPIAGGTVSIAYAAPSVLPLPLRDAHHPREYDLVSVNGRVLSIEDGVALVGAIWEQEDVAARVVDACLLTEAYREHGIKVPAPEIEEGIVALREARALYAGEAFEAWLLLQGLTEEGLEGHVASELARAKLRELLTAGRVESYFAEHAVAFDVVRVARFKAADREQAAEERARIEGGASDFFDRALERFLASQDGRASVPLFARLRRGSLEDEQALALFGAKPGDVVVVPAGEGFDVVRVLGLQKATLDAPTRALVAETIFEDWLVERRRGARVEWFWGRAREPTG